MNRVENFPSAVLPGPEDQLQAQADRSDSATLKSATLWPSQSPFLQPAVLNGAAAPALVQLLAANGAPAGSAIGTATSALTPAGNTLPPGPAGDMPYYVQKGNSCGTTTLAEIMSYLLGVHMTQSDVDSVIRRMNTFTAPDDMIDFARDHGLEAEGYNHGSWEEVKSMIDAGHPVQAMVGGDKSVSVNEGKTHFSVDGLHYIAITGYGTDPATGEEYVIYHDPNRDSEQRMSVKDFEKMWSDVPGGFDNYFIAYGAKGSNLPPGRDDGIEGTQGVLNGVTNITNGLDRIFSPDCFGDFVHGIPEFVGGLFQTVGCAVGGVFQLGANWLSDKVEGIPVLENVVQPFCDIVNGFGAVVGDLFDGFGEACDDIGNAFGSLCDGDVGGFVSGVGDAVGDAASAVGNAVSDAVDAVGDAIGDLFSGW